MREMGARARFGLSMVLLVLVAGDAMGERRGRGEESDAASKIERHQHDESNHHRDHEARRRDAATRRIDGRYNNLRSPEMGAADTPLARIGVAGYADGHDDMAGPDRPSARLVSNAVSAQVAARPNLAAATDYLWQWGQFLDHDIDLTEGAYPIEPADIPVPAGDRWFDPTGSGDATIELNRSVYTEIRGTREQINGITAWIDASNVYGSDVARARALRTLDGSGRLATSEGNLLPYNVDGLPNAGGTSEELFLAGDVRANEQAALTALHTLFVREHNRLADAYAARHPRWSGDRIYEKARRIVGAQMQVITYREFLPALLGEGALRRYRGYNPRVDASIRNEFSTAAYRFGHSALSPHILRLDADGNEIAQGNLALRDAFFNPTRISEEGGIDPILRGLAAQACQRVDVFVIDDVRNFLFGPPGSGGFDLASLNIQRGRDHGLPSYNEMRKRLGQGKATDFTDISSDPEVVERLAASYTDVDQVDLWAGGLAEDSVRGSHLGAVFHEIVTRQFEALRDGDRLWYARSLSGSEFRRVHRTRLADVIRRNTDIGEELPDRAFELR